MCNKPEDTAIAASTTVSNTGLVVTVTEVPAKTHAITSIHQDGQTAYPQARSPQIRVKSQAQLQAEPTKVFVQACPQIQIHAQPTAPTSSQPVQIQTITLPHMPQSQQTQHYQMLPLTPIQAQTKLATKQQTNRQAQTQFMTTNMGQLLPPTTIESSLHEATTITLDAMKTPKIVSAVSLAPRATFAAPFVNKGLQITAVSGGSTSASPPAPHISTAQLPLCAVTPALNALASPAVVMTPTSGAFNLPFPLPDKTNITKCPPLSCISTDAVTIMETSSLEAKIPATVLARPHLTPTSQLNANEIMIELISSVNGNQLVVHGPPLEQKYSLPMSTTALLIREVLSIPYLHKKDYNKPAQVNMCWQYLAKRFNLPGKSRIVPWNYYSFHIVLTSKPKPN